MDLNPSYIIVLNRDSFVRESMQTSEKDALDSWKWVSDLFMYSKLKINSDQGSEIARFWDLLGGEQESQELGLPSPSSTWIEPVLYAAPEMEQTTASDPLDMIVPSNGLLKKAFLESTGGYILDTGTQLFLWLGKNVSSIMRLSATELLAVCI